MAARIMRHLLKSSSSDEVKVSTLYSKIFSSGLETAEEYVSASARHLFRESSIFGLQVLKSQDEVIICKMPFSPNIVVNMAIVADVIGVGG